MLSVLISIHRRTDLVYLWNRNLLRDGSRLSPDLCSVAATSLANTSAAHAKKKHEGDSWVRKGGLTPAQVINSQRRHRASVQTVAGSRLGDLVISICIWRKQQRSQWTTPSDFGFGYICLHSQTIAGNHNNEARFEWFPNNEGTWSFTFFTYKWLLLMVWPSCIREHKLLLLMKYT